MEACSHHLPKEFFFAELEVRETDITSVHDALSHADPHLLLDAVLLIDPSWNASPLGVTGQARTVLLERLTATLEVMHALEPLVDHGLGQLIIPWQDFSASDDGSVIARGLGSCILHCNHVQLAQAQAARFEGLGLSVPCFLQALDGGSHPLEAFEDTGLLDPVSRISTESWPQALGRTVWLPRTLCQLERYSVLASIFWAMTGTGFGHGRNRAGFPADCSHDLRQDLSFFAEYAEKMDLFADVLNYRNWLNVIQAGERLCNRNACAASSRM